jgi:hypothetical protein
MPMSAGLPESSIEASDHPPRRPLIQGLELAFNAA